MVIESVYYNLIIKKFTQKSTRIYIIEVKITQNFYNIRIDLIVFKDTLNNYL